MIGYGSKCPETSISYGPQHPKNLLYTTVNNHHSQTFIGFYYIGDHTSHDERTYERLVPTQEMKRLFKIQPDSLLDYPFLD